MNDPDPPECKTAHDLAMDTMRKNLSTVCIDESAAAWKAKGMKIL